MLRRTSLALGLSVLLFALLGFTDKKPPVTNIPDVIEFPVYLQQKVAAGITPVGTKVQAKLTISTLVHGTVVPRDAIFSGEVIESTAKSGDTPSKLGIRMDMAQWKNGSLPIKVYLTEWYYPAKAPMPEDGSPGYSAIHGSIGITMGGGAYPPSTSSPSPGGRRASDDEAATLSPPGLGPDTTTASDVSLHRVRMQNVELNRGDDGSLLLSSKKNSIKLDKFTTYVMAAGDLLPQR